MLVRRKDLARRYSSRLSPIPWLAVPHEPADCRNNFQSYKVRLRSDAPVSRDRLIQELLDHGISSRRGIMAIHRERRYRSEDWDARLEVTNRVTDTTLILPLFHEMTDEEQDYVIENLTNIGEQAGR